MPLLPQAVRYTAVAGVDASTGVVRRETVTLGPFDVDGLATVVAAVFAHPDVDAVSIQTLTWRDAERQRIGVEEAEREARRAAALKPATDHERRISMLEAAMVTARDELTHTLARIEDAATYERVANSQQILTRALFPTAVPAS